MPITINSSETHAGPLRVFIGGLTAGITVDEMTISYEQETTPLDSNEFGQLDSVVLSNGATVSFSLAQIDPDVLDLAVPGGTLTGSGTLEVGSTRGLSLLSTAQQLVLSGTNGTTSQQWTFHKAFVEEGWKLEYQDEQSAIPLTFRVVPNPDDLEAQDALYKYETFVT